MAFSQMGHVTVFPFVFWLLAFLNAIFSQLDVLQQSIVQGVQRFHKDLSQAVHSSVETCPLDCCVILSLRLFLAVCGNINCHSNSCSNRQCEHSRMAEGGGRRLRVWEVHPGTREYGIWDSTFTQQLFVTLILVVNFWVTQIIVFKKEFIYNVTPFYQSSQITASM